MEPERPTTWPPAPTIASSVLEEPKPRLLTGRKGWDETIGWLGVMLLMRLLTVSFSNSFGFAEGCLHRLGIDPFTQPNLVFGLALGVPVIGMLSVSMLMYLMLKPLFPMLAKSFGQSLLFMVMLGAGLSACVGVWAHFCP